MWIIYAVSSSIFSGLTSVLASYSSKLNKSDSILLTTIRTLVILLLSFVVTIFCGCISDIKELNMKTIIFLILSGISTTLLWIFYFKALDAGDVSKVTPIDKTSIVITLILSSIFLKEKSTNNKWIIYAILTAIFTSTTTIISKVGLNNINSYLATFIRTIVVFIILIIIIFITKKYKDIKELDSKGLRIVIYSGITNTLSWLFYFKALQNGEASVVFTIEKLSIVVTILLSVIFLKEKLNKKQILGIIIISSATALLMF